eukprot:6181080-Pleurochrysis_carterae.AAC.3
MGVWHPMNCTKRRTYSLIDSAHIRTAVLLRPAELKSTFKCLTSIQCFYVNQELCPAGTFVGQSMAVFVCIELFHSERLGQRGHPSLPLEPERFGEEAGKQLRVLLSRPIGLRRCKVALQPDTSQARSQEGPVEANALTHLLRTRHVKHRVNMAVWGVE